MNAILALPLAVRLGLLFLLGTALGSLINLACYTLAWSPRPISPWSPPDPKVPPRRWSDRLPVLGWWSLRREARWHGNGFWIRPLAVELLCGALLAWHYWRAACEGALLPPAWIDTVPPAGTFASGNVHLLVHVAYLAQVLLIALMAVASLIDIDEKLIPDTITVPGTLLGLTLAAAYPWSLLPAEAWLPAPGRLEVGFLHLGSPNAWSELLNSRWGLALGLACWWGWCLAVMPLRWHGRRGWLHAVGLLAARVRRDPLLAIGLVGSAVITLVWLWAAPAHWAGLLTALVGMVGSGGLIWVVRIIGSGVLGREAMGFGDVTLMAMIGTFVGWQSAPIIFFLAPCTALAIAVGQWILNRNHEIPFGPFLCLATLLLVIFWAPIWNYFGLLYSVPWLVPVAMGVCLVMLGALLGVWVVLRRLLFGVGRDG